MVKELLNRVLVPLDGSAHAEAILSQLRRILLPHESHLTLLHAIPPAPWIHHEDEEKYLRRVSFQLTNDGYPTASLIRPGSPAETILDTALRERASLIALTTHGRTGAARWVLGSVAERVLQSSPIPVLVARSFPSTVCRGKLESQPIRSFLVPVDGSLHSLGALEPVINLARHVDAHVTLLHVTDPFPYDNRWEPPDETLKAADQFLREACIPARIEHRKGDPAEVILKTAEEEGIDLVAMTTHGRTGPSRWIFGSVATKVVRAAPVPLLVVRRTAPEKVAPSAEIHRSDERAQEDPIRGTGLAQHHP
jgi:nucleotide-binding universal stress UspA family protein